MTQTPIKLFISFESLAEAILALSLEDKVRLRQLLDEDIAPLPLEQALSQRGCSLPLKEGLVPTNELVRSGRTDLSAHHDEFITQQTKSEL